MATIVKSYANHGSFRYLGEWGNLGEYSSRMMDLGAEAPQLRGGKIDGAPQHEYTKLQQTIAIGKEWQERL